MVRMPEGMIQERGTLVGTEPEMLHDSGDFSWIMDVYNHSEA